MFKKILIANRGEIALRIICACKELGIRTVAIYSEADRNSLPVRFADEAICIGPPQLSQSYLNIPAVISAAEIANAEAIHPGYGLLSENANFAEVCETCGLKFIGPPPELIRLMGEKEKARAAMKKAGVPILPGSDGIIASEGDALEWARQVGFPVIIKASAGGGGRGMRIVRSEAELPALFKAASSEAAAAFGNGDLYMEKFVEHPRHIEFQILGDAHGNVVSLGERECSIQRRHQKLLEESPSTQMTPELRAEIGGILSTTLSKLGYVNAGTIEFLMDQNRNLYFIEMNTRIQVEHPVTEMVTGLDLIRLQIEIAQGGKLPEAQPEQKSHAIEARLYAEDPPNDFVPSTGVLHVWRPPETSPGLRIDSGVEEGTEIGVYYDPLLAKIVAHGEDRPSAIRKLTHSLRNFAAQGLQTNREFLIAMLESEEFQSGKAHTGFRLAFSSAADEELDRIFCSITRAYIERTEQAHRAILPSIPVRFRNNPTAAPTMKFAIGEKEYQIGGEKSAIETVSVDEAYIDALIKGVRHRFQIRQHGAEYYVRSTLEHRAITRLPRFPEKAASEKHQSANSPMPGQVLRILVAPGQQVKPGDGLIVLEAMKMEQTIKAIIQGVVRAVLVKPAEVVAPGQMLVEIDSVEDANEHASSSAAKH
jgi:acetyl-CoA carboxylase, biotin carboxylase subunit